MTITSTERKTNGRKAPAFTSLLGFLPLAIALSAAALFAAGCQRNIVKASPPSVSTPPPPATTPSAAPPSQPQPTTAPPSTPAPAPPPAPAPEPVPAKRKQSAPAPTEPEQTPSDTPRPEAPVISPELTPQAQAAAEQRTNSDIQRAEQNLQTAESKQLDEAQHDLVEKVRDFLAQAHEAVHAEDWVRASNLAEKARVLSDELVKSL